MPGSAVRVLDARLTPRAAGRPVSPLESLTLTPRIATVDLPVGTFGETITVSLTELSAQGLPAPLPPGWSPVLAFALGPENTAANLAFQLLIPGLAPHGLVVAEWQGADASWRRVDAQAEGGGTRLSLSRLSTVLFARPDVSPRAPIVPPPGGALEGVAPGVVPADASAAVLPAPTFLFLQPGALSRVSVELENAPALPSGTPVQVLLSERYAMLDGMLRTAPVRRQDLLLYQRGGALRAGFPAGPSLAFAPELLQEGLIRVDARRADPAPGLAVLGPAGGSITAAGGQRLSVPAGALGATTPVSVMALDPAASGFDDPRFEVLAGVLLDFAGERLAASAEWGVILDPLPASGERLLALRSRDVGEATRLELIGIATLDGAEAVSAGGGLGLAFPGLREGGRYWLVRVDESAGELAWITGTLSSTDGPITQVLTETDSLPFVSFSTDGEPAYVLATTLGEGEVTARTLGRGAEAKGGLVSRVVNAIEELNLQLAETGPAVRSVNPADGATGVSTTTPVTVRFSRLMDPATVTSNSLRLRADGTLVPISVSLLADRVTVLLSPAAPLASQTLHTVEVTADARDTFGNPLSGNQPDGTFRSTFTTADTTPPARPEAGRILVTLPGADGAVAVNGTQGTTEPGVIVSVRNDTTGAITSALSAADGSFSVRVAAGETDELSLVLRDASGNETVVSPPPMSDGLGTSVLGAGGGTIRLPDGTEVTFPQGAFTEPVKVTVERVERAEVPVNDPVDFDLGFAAALRIDTGGAEVLKPLKMRVPVSGSYPQGQQFLVTFLREVGDEQLLDVQETATYADGFAVINSPPWPGVAGVLFDIVILLAETSAKISFVTGKVLQAPQLGVVSMSHDFEVDANELTVLDVVASVTTPEVAGVKSLELFGPDGALLASMDSAGGSPSPGGVSGTVPQLRILHPFTADMSLAQQALSVAMNFAGIPQQALKFKAKAVIETVDGRTFVEELDGAIKVVQAGAVTTRKQTTRHVHDKGEDDANVKPARGAFVEVTNGLGRAYPSITTTTRTGGFVIAAAPGPGFFRVFDPLTGNGTAFPINVPNVPYDFTDVGTVYVPVSIGDAIPPTLEIAVSGTLQAGEPFQVTLNATDDNSIESMEASVLGQDQSLSGGTGAAVSESFDYTPVFPGPYRIDGAVSDGAGNKVQRSVLVTVSDAPGSGGGSATPGGGVSLETGATGVDPNVTVYAFLDTPVTPGASLSALTALDIHFLDVTTGERIEVVGGTDSTGARVVLRPATSLPFGAPVLLIGLGDTISFTTRGLSGLETLGGFKEIRGVAGTRTHAYVADFGDPGQGLKVLALSPGGEPTLLGALTLPGRARGVAVAGDRLVVVGGGQADLPFLRVYGLDNPAQPTRLATVILFPIKGQAVPTNVRVAGSFAYVATVGAGVQVVDLAQLVEFMRRPLAERIADPTLNPLEINGQASIVGGFRLPDPEHEPPLTGSALDVALGISATLTGGSQPNLYVLGQPVALVGEGEQLSAVFAGFNLIEQGAAGATHLNVGKPVQRLAMTSSVVVSYGNDSNGAPILQNVSLAAVSHGPAGLSLVDVTRPDQAAVVGTLENIGTVRDMLFLDRYLFTGNRVVLFDNPTTPIAGGPLSFTDEFGNVASMSSGGDVALADVVREPRARRLLTLLSSSGDRKALQVAKLRLSATARDWDVIRTTGYEPRVHPDNAAYLDTGDPVNPFTGEFVFDEVDLGIPGRGLHFRFRRTYRSAVEFDGPLGHGWDHNYNDRLSIDAQTGNVTRYDGSGRGDVFIPAGNNYDSPRGTFATLGTPAAPLPVCAASAELQLTDADGERRFYVPAPSHGTGRLRLECIEDRFGNTLVLRYDAQDRLITLVDSMRREIRFSYAGDSRLRAMTDFAGRQFTYRYDYDGNLMSVTGPPSEGFPQGQTTRYAYSGGFVETTPGGELAPTSRLNHNLERVIDPNGNEYLRNTYHPTTDPTDINFDRVWKQRLGDPAGDSGGTYEFAYTPSASDPLRASKATTTNRNGDVTEREYAQTGELETLVEKNVTLGSKVVDLTSVYTYHDIGLIKSVTSPGGVKTEYTWNAGANLPERRGDLTLVRVTPAGGGKARTWTYTPGAFGVATSRTDPEGHVTVYTLDARGLVKRIQHPQVTLPDGKGLIVSESYTYGTRGEVKAYTAPTGQTTSYEYHPSCTQGTSIPDACQSSNTVPGYLKSVTLDSSLGGAQPPGAPPRVNATSRFKYDLVGNLIEIEDARGTRTSYEVNAQNQRTRMTDPRGKVDFLYDGNGAVIQEVHDLVDLPLRTVTREFDALGLLRREVETAGPLSRERAFEYDPSENRTLVRMPSGAEVVMTYDERARPVAWRVPDAGKSDLYQIDLEYDLDGNVVAITDGAGQVVRTRYNGFNDEYEIEDGNGNRLRKLYDHKGLVAERRWLDPAQRTVKRETVERDALGRVTRLFDEIYVGTSLEDLAEYSTFHDASGRPVKVIDPLGNVSTYAYDGLDRPVDAVDAAGNRQQWEYDGLDLLRLTFTAAGGGAPQTLQIEFDFDDLGRLREEVRAPRSADSRTKQFDYNARDDLSRQVVGNQVVTTFTYDALGRPDTIATGRARMDVDYDLDDRVVRIADARNNAITIQYDHRNRIVQRDYADGSAETLSYRKDDSLARRTDRAGNVFDYDYDAGGRTTGVSVTRAPGFGGVDELRYDYDSLDQLDSATSSAGGVSRTLTILRNSLGAALSQFQGNAGVLSATDLMGRRTRTTYPGGRAVDIVRDEAGRVDELRDTGVLLARFEYLDAALRRAAVFGNGVMGVRRFNAAWEEDGREYGLPAATAHTGFDLGRDPAGRVIGIARSHLGGSGDAYEYTSEGWLGREMRGIAMPLAGGPFGQPGGALTDFDYDAAGNRVAVTAGGMSRNYESNALNQYSAVDGVDFTYDGNGNLRSDGSHDFEYDAFNNLLRVTQAGTGTVLVEYAYDALQRRVRASRAGTVENYVHDGADEVAVLDDAGSTLREYVHAEDVDRPVALRVGAEDFFYEYDHRGSVVALTDSTGSVVERYRYDAFGDSEVLAADGTPIAGTLVGNPLRFAGRPVDPATGLVYMRSRDYAPWLGRFLQADPAGTVDGPQLYAYAGNDPVNFTDPTGLFRRATADNIRTRSMGGMSLKDAIALGRAIVGAGRGVKGRVGGVTKALSDVSKGGLRKTLRDHLLSEAYKGAIGKAKGAIEKAEADFLKKHLKDIDPAVIDMVVKGANTAAGDLVGGFDSARKKAMNDINSRAARGDARTRASEERQRKRDGLKNRARNGGGYDAGGAAGVKRSPGCCCFEAGTPVLTADGSRAIEDLRVGDRVLSRDPVSGDTALMPVTELFLTEGKSLYRLTFENAAGRHELLGVTNNHPFFVEGQGWLDSAQLAPGMRVQSQNGMLTVVSNELTTRTEDTFNIEVAGFHTFFAGREEALVHNCSCRVNADNRSPARKLFDKVTLKARREAKAQERQDRARRIAEARKKIGQALSNASSTLGSDASRQEERRRLELRKRFGDVGGDLTDKDLEQIDSMPEEPTLGPNAAGTSGTRGYFGMNPQF